MSERIEILRQQAREEAAERQLSLRNARKFAQTYRSAHGVADVPYGATPCPRCAVRSDVGCKHRKGD